MLRTVFYIKLVHTFLFLLITGSTLYVMFSALFDFITPLTWFAFFVVILEMLVLILNDWKCPLTGLAERQGAEVGSVADLFLPKWISDRLFLIFGILFALTSILLVWRIL